MDTRDYHASECLCMDCEHWDDFEWWSREMLDNPEVGSMILIMDIRQSRKG